jgi:hypothetical protein
MMLGRIHRSGVPEAKGKNAPTLDEIRQRAFEIHIERGGHGGDMDGYLEAWLQADRELREEYNKVDDEDAKRK